jgi:site-specific DNA-cytosine methylase
VNATVGGLFDGIGLLAYGLTLAGWEHSWLCEVDPWRRELLALRWPGVPIYDDVRAVDARAERPLLIAGGFPCKGASTSGLRNGFDHPETVLWREMARTIGELRPRYVLVENVANLLSVRDGAVFGEVLGDLASLGFDVVWDCFPAAAFGAPHLRDRVIAIATNTDSDPVREQPVGECWSGCAAEPRRPGATPADASEGGRQGVTPVDGGQPTIVPRHDGRSGVQVEWGEYGPAVRRWEEVVGPAPEPLCSFRGVDAGSAATLERSRLSALGDGVQVQLGQLAGEYVLGLERERLSVMSEVQRRASDTA